MTSRTPAHVDVGGLIDAAQWGAFQKWILLLVAFALMLDGLANQVLGLALPALIDNWQVPRTAFAPVAALGLTGVTLGTLLGGMAGDHYGRRPALIASVLLFGLASLAAAGAHDVTTLAAARALDGLGIGGAIPNAVALVSEFTPLNRRSFAVAMVMVFIPVGGLLAGLLAVPLLPAFGWPSLFLAAGVSSPVLALVFALVLPESPRYLGRKQRGPALVSVLKRCRIEVTAGVQVVDARSTAHSTRLAALFGRDVAVSTVGLWLAFFFCLLAAYTIFSWVPTLLTAQGFSQEQASLAMAWFNLGGIAGGIAGGWLIGTLGSRRVTLALAAGAMLGATALALLPLSPLRPFAEVLGIMLVEGCFISGLHAGLYTVSAHAYDPLVRATGVGAASAVGRIGAILSSYSGVLAIQFVGRSGYFLVIAAAALLSMLSLLLVQRHIDAR